MSVVFAKSLRIPDLISSRTLSKLLLNDLYLKIPKNFPYTRIAKQSIAAVVAVTECNPLIFVITRRDRH